MPDRPRFEYVPRTAESVNRRAKQASGAYDSYLVGGITVFKPREGENCIRMFPPPFRGAHTEEDMAKPAAERKWGDHWGIDIYVHYNVGPDNGSYLCLDKMLGQACPVCVARLSAADEEEKDALRVGARILGWLADRHNEKAGPQAWAMPLGTSKDISARSTDKRTGAVLLVDSPTDGYDIFFDREGTDKKTKYARLDIDRDPTPLHQNPDTEKRWLDYIQNNPLPELLQFYDYEHIEKVLFGQVERKGGGERATSREPEEPQARRRPSEEPTEQRSGGSLLREEDEVRAPRRPEPEETRARPAETTEFRRPARDDETAPERSRARPVTPAAEREQAQATREPETASADPAAESARERIGRLGRRSAAE